jgi:hypothetical protein
MPSDRSTIQKTFMELFARHDLKIPDENLRDGTPGSLPYGSGRIMFAFGIDEREGGVGFMEYYAHHRIGGDFRGRIYQDGRHVSLPALSTMIAYNPDIPGDYERKEKENREEYKRIMRELIDVGIFSGGPVPGSLMINSHLVLRKEKEEDR